MSDFFLDNYDTTLSEKLTFFISPVYSERHYAESLQAKTWRGRTVHFVMAAVEKTLLFGPLIALVEAALAAFWFAIKSDGALKGWDAVLSREPVEEADFEPKQGASTYGKDFQSKDMPVSTHKHSKASQPDEISLDMPEAKESPVSDDQPRIAIPEPLLTDEEMKRRRDATTEILSTQGFEMEPGDRETQYGYKGEVQGTAALRFATAKATRDIPSAISPAALKEMRETNLEQYLILKLKRFGHALGLKGYLTLPSGKKFNLEGFCEAFTVPMIASSFQEFVRTNDFYSKEDCAWIVKNFNQTTSSDYTEPDDIQVIATLIQDPDFKGPISLGTGHHWHSTGTLFFGNYLIYCNRGWGDTSRAFMFTSYPTALSSRRV